MKILDRFASRLGYVPNASVKTSRELVKYLDYHNGVGSPLYVSGVLRCVDILSTSLARLPFRIIDSDSFEEQKDHRLYNKLRYEPNNWQSSFHFRRLMELRRITQGDAYAYIVRSGNDIASMQPLKKERVKVKQNSDWSLNYEILRPDNTWTPVPASDILHLRDISVEGLEGMSRTKMVKSAIDTMRAADRAQRNIFEKGSMAGGYFSVKGELGDEAYKRLKAQIDGRSGPEQAGKWWLLEDDMEAEQFKMTARDAQTVQSKQGILEDIARAWGVPRPLMMMDDTSWGSGVKELGTMFVDYGLSPGIEEWEQGCRRVLLTERDKQRFTLDFDDSVLRKGSLNDQAEFFNSMSGAGGTKPIMESNEMRKKLKLPAHDDGYGLVMAGGNNATSE